MVAKEVTTKYGVEAKAFRCDVSNCDSVLQVKDEIESSIGFVDILVNNAGILPLISLREGSPYEIKKIVEVNLTSHFWVSFLTILSWPKFLKQFYQTCRAFLNGMIKRNRGHIVAISSLGGIFGIPRACSYCATKSGVRGFMKSLYLELCADGYDKVINLTAVYPFFISTRAHIDHILDSMGMHSIRMSPSDVAQIIVKSMLRNKDSVVVPKDFEFLVKIVE
jgi:short-subunit dehydrogenase